MSKHFFDQVKDQMVDIGQDDFKAGLFVAINKDDTAQIGVGGKDYSSVMQALVSALSIVLTENGTCRPELLEPAIQFFISHLRTEISELNPEYPQMSKEEVDAACAAFERVLTKGTTH